MHKYCSSVNGSLIDYFLNNLCIKSSRILINSSSSSTSIVSEQHLLPSFVVKSLPRQDIVFYRLQLFSIRQTNWAGDSISVINPFLLPSILAVLCLARGAALYFIHLSSTWAQGTEEFFHWHGKKYIAQYLIIQWWKH